MTQFPIMGESEKQAEPNDQLGQPFEQQHVSGSCSTSPSSPSQSLPLPQPHLSKRSHEDLHRPRGLNLQNMPAFPSSLRGSSLPSTPAFQSSEPPTPRTPRTPLTPGTPGTPDEPLSRSASTRFRLERRASAVSLGSNDECGINISKLDLRGVNTSTGDSVALPRSGRRRSSTSTFSSTHAASPPAHSPPNFGPLNGGTAIPPGPTLAETGLRLPPLSVPSSGQLERRSPRPKLVRLDSFGGEGLEKKPSGRRSDSEGLDGGGGDGVDGVEQEGVGFVDEMEIETEDVELEEVKSMGLLSEVLK